MRNSKFVAIPCQISRGGFSDERVFSFFVDGKEYSGVASRRHMWSESGVLLEEGEPPLGIQISGFVAARVVEVRENERLLISVPDGGVVEIPASQFVQRPSGAEKNVLV